CNDYSVFLSCSCHHRDLRSFPTRRSSDLVMMAVRFKVLQRDRSMVLVTEGLGPQPFHGRIVVLINEHTHSAAEMVASFGKQNHRSEEHTSELQSLRHLVCRLLLEKKKISQ